MQLETHGHVRSAKKRQSVKVSWFRSATGRPAKAGVRAWVLVFHGNQPSLPARRVRLYPSSIPPVVSRKCKRGHRAPHSSAQTQIAAHAPRTALC